MIGADLRAKIEQLAALYPDRRSALIPALHEAQRALGGYVDRGSLSDIAGLLGIPVATAYGVQTYYTMFNRGPIGRYHLQVDTNVPAMLAGADKIVAHLARRLKIKVGETTRDGLFTLSTVEDLASCGTTPVIQVSDRYYENVTPEKADRLLASLRQDIMPDWPREDYFGTQCGILLARRGRENSTSIETYLGDGGYGALAKALPMKPDEVTAEVKAANLRGRGGAGFPTGVKWGFLPRNTGRPTYLVCNADEGEPGTFKDRQIMEFDPHLLLEGMAISAHAIGAELGFIYIRGEFAWIGDILERAIAEARAGGYLGQGMLGTAVNFEIIVHRGAGAYVCGEETALIESLEGKRGNPRMKPPFPAVAGLYGSPTVVNNVETLANVPFIIAAGAGRYREIGTPNNFGPKIFGVSGHVNRPGAYEFPLGTLLQDILSAAGEVKGRFKAVIVGGLSVPILTAEQSRGLVMDYDSCLKRGTMLGSGGIIVMNETTSIPQVALRTIEFYAHESCGQCTPCRQGSHTIRELLRGIVGGCGRVADIDTILRLCGAIKGATLCPTGEAFAAPVSAMVSKFRGEFEALIR